MWPETQVTLTSILSHQGPSGQGAAPLFDSLTSIVTQGLAVVDAFPSTLWIHGLVAGSFNT